MRILRGILPALILVSALSSAGSEVATGVAELNAARYAYRHKLTFALTTTVERVYLHPDSTAAAVYVRTGNDWSSFMTYGRADTERLRPGDIISVSGHTVTALPAADTAHADGWRVIGRGKPSELAVITPTDLQSGGHDDELAILRGTVTDAFADDIDQRYFWMSVSDGTNTSYASINITDEANPHERTQRLVGARIEVPVCVCRDSKNSWRRKLGRNAMVFSLDEVRVLDPPPADPFDILGRQRYCGRVEVTWQRRHALLRLKDTAEYCRVEFAEEALPRIGDFIEVSGIPMTDFYCDNLACAVWRPTAEWSVRAATVTDIVPQDILASSSGARSEPGIDPLYNGNLVRLTGRVIAAAGAGSVLKMVCKGQVVPVDISSAPELESLLEPGCEVSVCGICLIDVPNWTHGGPFPRIGGFTIVVRKADEATLLARPPWWTPTRFLIALGVLAAVIILILVWNASLRLLVARRSRQLVREQAEKLGAELRIDERTRLAAELHDSVAQNLSSVSMQLDAVQLAAHDLAEPFRTALGLASKTLLSCRQELRNCLWDLRSQALDEPDLGTAVLKTLKPHLNGAALRIRFNVSRRLVSDQTAHAVLRILRELAANAIRHGRARNLTVAGCLDGRLLRFSLTDDGSGFDPKRVAGVDSGHFGLSGIRDRVNKSHGTFEISSDPGRGTKAVVTLNAQ